MLERSTLDTASSGLKSEAALVAYPNLWRNSRALLQLAQQAPDARSLSGIGLPNFRRYFVLSRTLNARQQPFMVSSMRQISSHRRRALFISAGAVAAVPRLALSSVFRCGPELRIAVLVPLTGPLAGAGLGYFEGIQQAVSEARARGCAVSLVALDASTATQKVQSTARAAQHEGASVIIAPYGAMIASLAAQGADDALVVDLLQSSPLKVRPPNLVAVPYTDLFFTSNPERRTESLRTVGRAAVTIVLETIRGSEQGSIRKPAELIDAMARRRFQIPGGPVALDRASGAFRRV